MEEDCDSAWFVLILSRKLFVDPEEFLAFVQHADETAAPIRFSLLFCDMPYHAPYFPRLVSMYHGTLETSGFLAGATHASPLRNHDDGLLRGLFSSSSHDDGLALM